MKPVAAVILAALLLPATAHAAADKSAYWFLLKEKEQRWCGYADKKTFDAAVQHGWILEVAQAEYQAGKISSLFHQIDAESGDWRFADEYAVSKDGTKFRRTFTRVDPFVRVIQEARFGGSHPSRLHTVSRATKDKLIDAATSADMPEIPVATSFRQFSFLKLVTALQRNPARVPCTGA